MGCEEVGEESLLVINVTSQRVRNTERSRPLLDGLRGLDGRVDLLQRRSERHGVAREFCPRSISEILALPGNGHGKQARKDRGKNHGHQPENERECSSRSPAG
jgi:hypothetical protein